MPRPSWGLYAATLAALVGALAVCPLAKEKWLAPVVGLFVLMITVGGFLSGRRPTQEESMGEAERSPNGMPWLFFMALGAAFVGLTAMGACLHGLTMTEGFLGISGVFWLWYARKCRENGKCP